MIKQRHEIDPIYAYNSDGKKHRAPIDVLYWIDGELKEAYEIEQGFIKTAVESDYSDYENEISRHEQAGFITALEYVKRYLERRD